MLSSTFWRLCAGPSEGEPERRRLAGSICCALSDVAPVGTDCNAVVVDERREGGETGRGARNDVWVSSMGDAS